MTWFYNDKEVIEIDEKYVAFVYLITNLTNNKRYIGKKLLKFTKTKQKNGKKKKIKVDSDWRTYFGSSNELNKDVEKIGQENFKREILILCLSKGTASYYEGKLQFQYEVLENQENWYNQQIRLRCHASHIKKEPNEKI